MVTLLVIKGNTIKMKYILFPVELANILKKWKLNCWRECSGYSRCGWPRPLGKQFG